MNVAFDSYANIERNFERCEGHFSVKSCAKLVGKSKLTWRHMDVIRVFYV